MAEQSARAVLEIDSSSGDVGSTWNFDHVFDSTSGTEALYNEVGEAIIQRGLEGHNGTLFCYGQTASGKTHTLMGTPEDPGIVPRSVKGVFDAIAGAAYSNMLVRVSYIEVYNEELKDLLASDMGSSARLRIVDDPKTGPWVHSAVQAVATSAEHVLRLIEVKTSPRSSWVFELVSPL